MINQQACSKLLLACLVVVFVSQHQVWALESHDSKQRKLINSNAQVNNQYRAFDDQLALETNQILAPLQDVAYKYGRDEQSAFMKPNYEANDSKQSQGQRRGSPLAKHQREAVASNSIADEQSPFDSKQAIEDSRSRMAKSSASENVVDNAETAKHEYCSKTLRALQKQFVEQVIKQRVVDEDHMLMERWLVENVKDLHRELKQTEMDFEHYVQVTKKMFARYDLERSNYLLKRQLAMQTALPLSIPLPVASAEHNASPGTHNHDHREHDYSKREHLAKLLLGYH